MFERLVAQGSIGYTQYFLGDNAAVIELHLLGAALIVCAVVGLLPKFPTTRALAATWPCPSPFL